MGKTIKTRVLELLAECPDGLTTVELSTRLNNCKYYTARTVLGLAQKSVYIDRWVAADRGKSIAVWCVVIAPANCPKPDGRAAVPRQTVVG